MPDFREIKPVSRPIKGTVRPPGSKSLSNRALLIAALAEGRSELLGLLASRDTEVMIDSLRKLGIDVRHDPATQTAQVVGCAGKPPASSADLWLENSGTSIRFLTAACTLGHGRYRLDGNARMRERPIGELVTTLDQLGANVNCELNNACPPVVVQARGMPGGIAKVAGNISSQYLSALLMAAPCASSAVDIELIGELVSEPYVAMTSRVMSAFGAAVEDKHAGRYRIPPQRYKATRYAIEPDASAASYFFAAAAITGGEVTVSGLAKESTQGDVGFVNMLEQMGCTVEWRAKSVTVRGGSLRGIDVDMGDISDTAQTLAVVAPFADGPTRIRNVAHMRHKETDRVSAVVAELRRVGLQVEEHDDGLTIHPGSPQPATIQTYDDHRMAMSFALLGLRAPGIVISDPGCTAKTFPHFFDDLDKLCANSR